MTVLVLAGLGPAAGKTAVACGLLTRWKEHGRSVGYVAVGANAGEQAAFIAHALGLSETTAGGVATAAHLTLPSADVTVVELVGDAADPGVAAGLVAVAAKSGGKVLPVVRYEQHLEATAVLAAVRGLGVPVVGVVVNDVPARYTLPMRERLTAPLDAAGTPLLGLVPEDVALGGFSVGELADHLGASFLSGEKLRDTYVANLMVGPNAADPAFSWFHVKPNTAIICRANRPDLQLAALEQSVSCMVLTGDGRAQTSVVNRAEDARVPVILVPDDTIGTVRRLDGLTDGVRFRQAAKVPVMQDLVDGRIDWRHLDAALGLA